MWLVYVSNCSQSTSVKYSSPSSTRGTRLMLVCNVALGHTWETNKTNTDLKSPPKGYQSVHGVKGTDQEPSEFKVTNLFSGNPNISFHTDN